ncbi:hypothetical protein BLNAU_2214 [Blattamonas nauphoetae]|uniref:Uncharacterized protein n=1 Tax=Blattamonas nauphoetae TaxID=2049346 RepID=A0ABQ9YGS1_9EUKA|nr:hypothetical protein BLNAU_2214 [Blattamonas nauphoetae]
MSSHRMTIHRPSNELIQRSIDRLESGLLILKEEANGLHLRWIALNARQDHFFWVNPKKEVLTVDEENKIDIADIDFVLMSPDAFYLVADPSEDAEEIRDLTRIMYRFTIVTTNAEYTFVAHNRDAFLTIIYGLCGFIGSSRIVRERPTSEYDLPSLDPSDTDFVYSHLKELCELIDSLYREVDLLMSKRQEQDLYIDDLLENLNECNYTIQEQGIILDKMNQFIIEREEPRPRTTLARGRSTQQPLRQRTTSVRRSSTPNYTRERSESAFDSYADEWIYSTPTSRGRRSQRFDDDDDEEEIYRPNYSRRQRRGSTTSRNSLSRKKAPRGLSPWDRQEDEDEWRQKEWRQRRGESPRPPLPPKQTKRY